MKTNTELETLIQNLIERQNRLEAMLAHAANMRPDYDHKGTLNAMDAALVAIDRATAAQTETGKMLKAIADDLRGK